MVQETVCIWVDTGRVRVRVRVRRFAYGLIQAGPDRVGVRGG